MRLLRRGIRRFWQARSLRTLASIPAYDLWAANYPPMAHNALMRAEEAAMRDLMPPLAGRVVLDLACGTGRYGILAAEQGAAHVIGIDNSAAMLGANALAARVQATSEAIPLASRSVDVVLCGLALGHLLKPDASLREMARVLAPDGVALVSDFHPFMFLSGAKRTFTAPDGRVYAVEHHAHLYSDYQQAANAAGLTIDAVREPSLDGRVPVAIVYRFQGRGRLIST